MLTRPISVALFPFMIVRIDDELAVRLALVATSLRADPDELVMEAVRRFLEQLETEPAEPEPDNPFVFEPSDPERFRDIMEGRR